MSNGDAALEQRAHLAPWPKVTIPSIYLYIQDNTHDAVCVTVCPAWSAPHLDVRSLLRTCRACDRPARQLRGHRP